MAYLGTFLRSTCRSNIPRRLLVATLCTTAEHKPPPPKVDLVVFDKDGTVFEYGSHWTKWTIQLAANISQDTGINLSSDELLQFLGYDLKDKCWRDGLINDPEHVIIKSIAELLPAEGYKGKDSEDVVSRVMTSSSLEGLTEEAALVAHPQAIFRTLRYFSIKTALCTTDSRDSTERMLYKYGLSPFLDVVLCGDDQKAFPKPDSRNIDYICRRLNVCKENTVVVGDSQRDVVMGKSAGAALSVGVLSGVCEKEELEIVHAEAIIPSIDHLLKLILHGKGYEDIYQSFKEKPNKLFF